jgi:hypothetical protein
MYEVKQAAVARAIDVLRAGPMTAAAFAVKMWPDRVVGRTPGQHSKMGHGFLRRLGELNYVERVGDLWMLRRFGSGTADESAVHDGTNGHLIGGAMANGQPMGPPVGLSVERPNGQANGQAVEQAERLRLARLVQQASDPVGTVTHDAAFGDIMIRGAALDSAIVEACAIVVLLGRSANVYPPCGAARMIVGLSPAESARALYLRWIQSGQPPELSRASAWIAVEDGIVATPGFWRPSGASAGWVDPEDVRARVGRQRAAAGLA